MLMESTICLYVYVYALSYKSTYLICYYASYNQTNRFIFIKRMVYSTNGGILDPQDSDATEPSSLGIDISPTGHDRFP